jgi:hypothetical protein
VKNQTHGKERIRNDMDKLKTIEMKITLLFYGLVARDDENIMVACQN